MGAVKKHDRIVLKYLKKTGRFKTVKELQKSLDKKQKKDERKPVKLSFVIQKAPERVKAQSSSSLTKKAHPKVKKELEEKKAVAIPDKFKKIAKKFGLPEDHLEFFYTNRESFHWETKDKTEIQCTEVGCKHTVKVSPGCLMDHMISVHNYRDIPCDKTDCSFIAFSDENLTHHRTRFHGHGKKPVDFANHTCTFSTCKVSFAFPSQLRRHLDVHENRVLSCNYCPYRNAVSKELHKHLLDHFRIKNFACDICSRKFATNNELQHHHRIAHSTDDFVCVDCKFATTKLGAFQNHRTTCTERLKHSRIL
jgi:hypothetical protein